MENENSLPVDGSVGNRQNMESFTTPSESFVSTIDGKSELSSETFPRRQRMAEKWKKIMWPPRGRWAKYFTYTLILCSVLAAFWAVFPAEVAPDQHLFSLVITILLSIAAEFLIVKIPTPKRFPPIPPLLASLLMGMMLRNLPPPGDIANHIESEVSAILRKIALTVILTRAGLEINPEAMKKVKWAVIRLAFTPCIVETCCIGIFGHLILQLPWVWSFMMGFVIAAVSPAVVVPSLILLKNAGYGINKGIPSLVMAASGIDDVLAITGFTILLGIAVSSEENSNFISKLENLFNSASNTDSRPIEPTEMVPTGFPNTSYIMSTLNATTIVDPGDEAGEIGKEVGTAVIEVVLGVLTGLFFGFLISYIPNRKMKHKSFCRGFLLLGIGMFMVFATELWEIGGTGTLCALIMSFTASLKWKDEAIPLAEAWYYMWIVFQPILFGLTGALIDFKEMDPTTVGLGLAVLGIALVFRLITSSLVTFGLKLNLKEKLFIAVAWIPKGTVQAALGSAAMDKAIALNHSQQEIDWGQEILVLAVLITLITAPLGSFGISIAGPYLLSKSDPDTDCRNDEEGHPDRTQNGVDHTLPRPNSQVMRSAHLIDEDQNDDDEDDDAGGDVTRPNLEVMRSAHLIGEALIDCDVCDGVDGDVTENGGAENLAYEDEKNVATAL